MKLYKSFLSVLLGSFAILLLMSGTVLASDESVAENTRTGQKFETLAAAVSAAEAGDTVKMIKDHSYDDTVVIDKDLVLDLNGKTITSSGPSSSTIKVAKGKTVTVKDSSNGAGGSIVTTGKSSAAVNNSGTFVLESGSLIGNATSSYAYGLNNDYLATSATINGGSVKCLNSTGVAVYTQRTLTVNEGAVVEGGVAAIHANTIYSHPVTINGGTLYNTNTAGTGSAITCQDGTVTVNGGNIYATHGLGVRGGTIVVPETSTAVVKAVGSVSSKSALYVGEGGGTFRIAGGWYSDKVNDSYVADGYTATDERPESERIDKNAPYTVLKYYDLYIGGVRVNNKNKNDIPTASGKASYNPETNTMTLNNATIDVVRGDVTAADTDQDHGSEKPECGIIVKEEEPFTINLIGKNTIADTSTEEGANTKAGICLLGTGKGTVTFTGGGSLDVRMTKGDGMLNKGISIQRDVDLDGVDVNIEMSGGAGGVNTKGVLVVDGTNTLFTVKKNSSLYITTDKGYAFDSNEHATGIHLSVENGAVFEAVSQDLAIHHGKFRYVQLTAETKALGALLNLASTQEGAQEYMPIPDDLGKEDDHKYKYVRIPVTHVWSDWETVTEPTCTTGGKAVHHCKNKDCTAEETKDLPALGHKWGPWKVTRQATVKAEGEETRTCTRSGCNAKETRKIPKVAAIKTTADIPAKTMEVSWKKIKGAKKYKVAYRLKGKKWKIKKTKKTKYTIKGMKKAKYYEFKVAPVYKNGKTGKYSEVSYRFFRAVKGTAEGVAGGAKLTWTKEPKAKGYIVYCSTSEQFKKYKEVQLNGKNRTSYTFKGLKKGKTYYVIVRSYIKKSGKKYLGITYPIKKVTAK